MENYTKGKNFEPSLESVGHPFSTIIGEDSLVTWMKVKAGSKIHNLMSYALNDLKTKNYIIWSGFGHAVGKVVSCAEMMKRRKKQLCQITRISYIDFEEYWDPKDEGLDQLKVVRKVPIVHILLSKLPLDPQELGYQAHDSNLFDVPKTAKKKPRARKPKIEEKEAVSEE
ncbi:ribonuclease P protein subunit p25-like protein [Artemia franciscana]|uniref:DNA/RNA-binding protein Alba-like domain-containing protein n=1 Tax=Artemia franciscana TaxID=6661 RepID=A0AA88HR99_ARTSF|nr:hypothetical protein QYM36_013694 [Artemia franciscana]KAK2710102.1 hypothetical protein QYM36_013694 [Artemia franciscana]KAK2710103.1 hypothetical protein QYM36_013694 [Artemia franciscana]